MNLGGVILERELNSYSQSKLAVSATGRLLLLEHEQGRDESLEAEQIVAIGGDVDPVDDVLGGGALDSCRVALFLRQHLLLAGLEGEGVITGGITEYNIGYSRLHLAPGRRRNRAAGTRRRLKARLFGDYGAVSRYIHHPLTVGPAQSLEEQFLLHTDSRHPGLTR